MSVIPLLIRNRIVWLFLSVVLLTVVAYQPGLSGDYMFDDMSNILNNDRLEVTSLNLEELKSASFSSGSGHLRRPVSMLSFALNRYFFGLAPYSYKAVNLGIHLLTGLGLLLLGRLIIRSYKTNCKPDLSPTIVASFPLIICALWLVHPLNLTSVLYIVQRMASLAALFTVFGLCLYVSGRQRLLEGRRGWPLILAGLIGCGTLAIFSKENGALLPVFMLILELSLFRFADRNGNIDKTVVLLYTLVLILPGCLVLWILATQPAIFLTGYEGRNFTLTERVMTEGRVLVFYLKMIVLPSTSELGMYHDDIRISRALLDPPTTLPALVFLTGLLMGALLILRKQPLVSLGILWFFSAHLMESTILPLEIAHEHRNYLADYGILLAIVAVLMQLPFRQLSTTLRYAPLILFIGLFSYITWLRAGQWSDNVNFSVYEARHHPESFRSVYAAGRIHARLALAEQTDQAEQPKHIEQAFRYLEKANQLGGNAIMPNVVMIKLSSLLDRPYKQVWLDEILDKLGRSRATPSSLNSLYELAKCAGNRCKIPHSAMEEMFRLVVENKDIALAPNLLAETVTIHGYYSINIRGDFDKGLELFIRAVETDPRVAQRWINIINLLTVMNRLDAAEQRLAQFRVQKTYSGNTEDYRTLQQAINDKREQALSPGGSGKSKTGEPETGLPASE